MEDYMDIAALSAVYLEDSFVLDVLDRPGRLEFRLDVVVTPRHPRYRKPLPGQQYCYEDGRLVFTNVSRTEWINRSFQSYVDAAGETDFGSIDVLRRDDDHWLVSGDWGEVRVVTAADPELLFCRDHSH